jgi:hypothetical protein
MIEKIGKAVLDDTCYPGQDLYSDGAIEDEMLEIARAYPKEQWNQVIAERKKLAHSLSFFPYKGKYFKLASVYRKGKCAGDRFRLRSHYRCAL